MRLLDLAFVAFAVWLFRRQIPAPVPVYVQMYVPADQRRELPLTIEEQHHMFPRHQRPNQWLQT